MHNNLVRTLACYANGEGPIVEKEVKKMGETGVDISKLKNNVKVILNKNTELPFVNICLVFKGGVLFEPDDKKGLTSFMNKMLLYGTKKR